MCKWLLVGFVLLFALTHRALISGNGFEDPLSTLREGENASACFACFGIFVLCGITISYLSFAASRKVQAAIYSTTTLLLLISAISDSMSNAHLFATQLSLAILLLAFGRKLILENRWIRAAIHFGLILGVGGGHLIVERFGGINLFALWQFILICYLITLAAETEAEMRRLIRSEPPVFAA
jgi:hypothetical protein